MCKPMRQWNSSLGILKQFWQNWECIESFCKILSCWHRGKGKVTHADWLVAGSISGEWKEVLMSPKYKETPGQELKFGRKVHEGKEGNQEGQSIAGHTYKTANQKLRVSFTFSCSFTFLQIPRPINSNSEISPFLPI